MTFRAQIKKAYAAGDQLGLHRIAKGCNVNVVRVAALVAAKALSKGGSYERTALTLMESLNV